MPLPKKLHRIAQRGIFRHLRRIAAEVDSPLSLPELDKQLGFQPNKMRSLKAIMAKLENRFGLRFLVSDPDGGIDFPTIGRVADEIAEVARTGVEVGLVVGGGLGWPPIRPAYVLALLVGIGGQFLSPIFTTSVQERVRVWPAWQQVAIMVLGLVTVSTLGPEGVAPFIYFRF